jgi:hypothetical protein
MVSNKIEAVSVFVDRDNRLKITETRIVKGEFVVSTTLLTDYNNRK